MNDDFLREFQQNPPPEFEQALLEKLHNIEEDTSSSDDSERSDSTPRKPLPAWPRFRWKQREKRTNGRAWSLIAAVLVVMATFGLLTVGLQPETTTQTAADVADTNQVLLPNRVQSPADVQQMAWSPDNEHLYIVGQDKMLVLDHQLQRVDSWSHGIDVPITAMAVDEWGYNIALGTEAGGVQVVQTRSSMIVVQYTRVLDRPVRHIEFVPGVRQIIAASDTRLARMDVSGVSPAHQVIRARVIDTGSVAETIMESNDPPAIRNDNQLRITGISLHPDGEDVLVVLSNSVMYRYTLTDNQLVLQQDNLLPASLQAIYSATGDTLITAWRGSLYLLNSETYQERRRYALPNPSLFWLQPLQRSATGQRLLLNNTRQSISIWDFQAADSVQLWSGERNDPHTPVASLSSDGQLVAILETPRQIALWQILPYASGEVRAERIGTAQPFTEDANAVRTVSVSDDVTSIRSDAAADAPVQLMYAFGDGYLTDAQWSPDGRELLVVGTTKIRIYDDTLRLLQTWPVQRGDITQAAYSPDSQWIATGNSTGDITLWQADGNRLATLAEVHDSPVTMLHVLPDGAGLLSRAQNGDFALLQFDGQSLTVSGREMLEGYDVLDVHASSERIRLLVKRDGQNLRSGRTIQVLEMALDATLQGSTGGVNGYRAYFLDDGQAIILYSADDISVHSADTLEWQRSLETMPNLPAGDLNAYLMSRDSLRVSGLQSTTVVSLADVLAPRALTAMALHPAGDKVALITSHYRVQLQHITETTDGTLTAEVKASDTPVTGRIRSLLSDGDNLAVVTTEDNSVLFFDTLTGHMLRRIPLNTQGTRNHEIRFSPDESLLLVTGQSSDERDTHLHMIDVQAAITGADNPFYRESVTIENQYLSGTAFLEDGRFLTGGGIGRIWRFGGSTMYVDEELPNLRGLTVFSASPQGDLLATVRPGSYLSILRTMPPNVVYETRLTGRMMQEDISVDFLPDSEHIVLALNGQEVRLYSVESGLEIATLTRNGETIQNFQDMTVQDDLVLLSQDDGLHLWQTDTLPTTTDARHITLQHTAREIALSGGGSRLLVVGDDGRIHVYNAD